MNLTELATKISGKEAGKVNLPIAQISEVLRALGDVLYVCTEKERTDFMGQCLYNAGRRAKAAAKDCKKAAMVKAVTKASSKKAPVKKASKVKKPTAKKPAKHKRPARGAKIVMSAVTNRVIEAKEFQ